MDTDSERAACDADNQTASNTQQSAGDNAKPQQHVQQREREQRSVTDERIGQWIDEHGNSVRRYLFAIVRRVDLAEDLFQDVFVKASVSIERYEERGCAKAYLLRIAQRLARAHFRRHRNERLLDEQQWILVEPTFDQDPDEDLLVAESRAELLEAMVGLSTIQRRVLCLRYYSELDFQTIADLMDCPVNTVHSHCRRAIETLRKELYR